MKSKEALYAYCLEYVEERIARIKQQIANLQLAANEETKSSAGDKYETSRAMAQLEVEMNTRQLIEAKRLHSTLLEVSLQHFGETVRPGSLVVTSEGIFFMAISIGLITIESNSYMVISVDSPIGKFLLGRKVGDTIVFNGISYHIQSID